MFFTSFSHSSHTVQCMDFVFKNCWIQDLYSWTLQLWIIILLGQLCSFPSLNKLAFGPTRWFISGLVTMSALYVISYWLSLWILVYGGMLLNFTLVSLSLSLRLEQLVQVCAPSNILPRIANFSRCLSDIIHSPLLIHRVLFLFRRAICPVTNIHQIFTCLHFHAIFSMEQNSNQHICDDSLCVIQLFIKEKIKQKDISSLTH